jgi:hypothetical protein
MFFKIQKGFYGMIVESIIPNRRIIVNLTKNNPTLFDKLWEEYVVTFIVFIKLLLEIRRSHDSSV